MSEIPKVVSKFITVKGSKMHYLESGTGDPILFLHGNPTSAYLWRNIIPYLAPEGRCIAPDLIGMGQSDQPDLNYGFQDTYDYLEAFITALDLKQITLVVHDWGSALGFHYAYQHKKNIKGLAFMEAVYKLLDWKKLPLKLKVGMSMMRFKPTNWLMIGWANLFIKKVIPNGTIRQLKSEEQAQYAAPYPTIKSRKPLRVWPREIVLNGEPKHLNHIISNYHNWLKDSMVPKLCLYASPGMLIHESEIQWIEDNINQVVTINIGDGLHFVQEDQPDAIGKALVDWYLKI